MNFSFEVLEPPFSLWEPYRCGDFPEWCGSFLNVLMVNVPLKGTTCFTFFYLVVQAFLFV